MLTNRTPEAHQWALEQFRKFRSEGQFVPFSVGQDTVVFPGFDGGAEWGGSAFDPETGLLYVNANDMAWTARWRRTRPPASGRKSTCSNAPPAMAMTWRERRRRFPSLIGIARPAIADADRRRSGRAKAACRAFPICPRMTSYSRSVEYVMSGESKELQESAPRRRTLKYRFTGYNKFFGPGRVSGGRAALGHAECDQPEHRRVTPGRFRSANIPTRGERAENTGSRITADRL